MSWAKSSLKTRGIYKPQVERGFLLNRGKGLLGGGRWPASCGIETDLKMRMRTHTHTENTSELFAVRDLQMF